MVTNDELVHEKVLKAVMDYLQSISFNKTPPEISMHVHQIIKEVTKCDDPYQKAKGKNNALAKRLYPWAKSIINKADDKLLAAIKIAIAGNVIDFGASMRFDVEKTMMDALKTRFAINDYEKFKLALKKAEKILYLGDNAGEVVFDKLLLNQLANAGKEIVYAVKERPIINDATMEDAIVAEIDKMVKVIAVKGNAPGVILRLCPREFMDYYDSANMVIAKGQGNYESLSDEPIFFLLIVKCELVARDLGVKVGDIVLKRG
jgi:hypothetical protein